jgi:multidrug efflux pump subunit AcrA (membrane-fusion protein)
MLTATVGSWYDPASWFTVTEETPAEKEPEDQSIFSFIMDAAAEAAEAQAAADAAAAKDKAAAQAAADAAAQAAAAAKSAATAAAAKAAAEAAAKAKAQAQAAAGTQPFYKKPLFWGGVGGGVVVITLGVLLLKR